ncbi:hypothetical protein F5050DRAFT_1712161 [Lentinula boryana]|uniref:Uncharacterized protein n=1 Tax=Lentinula boryana TaxID=40481 RepID=A0ABQ8QD66_9AGAR|nr:hypothetical protein F5050DRAFT_1712161 [Lentinula boryana]
MLTGAELSIAVTVASKIISTLSTHGLKKRTDEILGDQELANLLGELYKLNEEQAERQNRKWEMASEKIELLAVRRGPKEVLVQYSIARSAYFLAQSYKKDTARAKITGLQAKRGTLIEFWSKHRLLNSLTARYINIRRTTWGLDELVIKLTVTMHIEIDGAV